MKFSPFEHILTHISFSVISMVIPIHLISLLSDEFVGLSDSSEKGKILNFLCITGLVVTRWLSSGHLPVSDLYESLIFLSWVFSLIHMGPYFNFKKHKNFLSAITSPSTLFTQVFTTSGLLTDMHPSENLVPALQSQWLMMHVSMMVLGYAALLCGSLLGVALLVIRFRKVERILDIKKNLLNNIFSNNLFSFDQIQYLMESRKSIRTTFFLSSWNYYRFQLIQQLDRWGYRIISLGFVFLTIGILSGAVWANEAWGSYWNWDPKETWAFITWTLFAIYLHSRKNFESFNSAIIASIGFLVIWICYFGVNLLGIGLHSYGSFILN
nr:cytochrome c heme attachment protein [Hypericum perforatum]WNE39684.1 cytochrome c heme attachment protein [Hypericum perforatum]